MRCQRSSGCPTKRWLPPPPAPLTRTSTWPSPPRTAPASRSTSPASVTSATTPSVGPPRAASSAAVSSTAARVRAATATAAPASASARAVLRPIPRLPPVTSATFPLSDRFTMTDITRRWAADHAAGMEAPLVAPPHSRFDDFDFGRRRRAVPGPRRGGAQGRAGRDFPVARVERRLLQDAEIAAASGENVVDLVGRREIAADERRHVHLVADLIAERRQVAAPVHAAGLGRRLAREDLDQVAAPGLQRLRDDDRVLDVEPAPGPVGRGDGDRDRALLR